MREQRGFAKRGLASGRDDLGSDAGQFAEQRLVAAERQGDECGAWLDDLQAELPREEIGRASCRERVF